MNDTIITFTGNLTADPELRETPAGITVATIRVASTQRRFDKAAQEWSDGATNYFRVSCWRGLGTRVAASLRKGDPVFVSGKFTSHSYELDGVQRTSNEVDAMVVGPDLTRATAKVERTPRPPAAGEGTPAVPPQSHDPWVSQSASSAGESAA